jgi:hypothetical protein
VSRTESAGGIKRGDGAKPGMRRFDAWPGRTLAATIIVLVIAACATVPRVEVAYDPNTDFAQYATFGFQSPLGTDRADGTASVLSGLLKAVTRDELEALGYRYAEESPDLMVDFFVETREKLEGYLEPRWGMRYGYYGWHRPWGLWSEYDTARIRQYTEGTLHVDVADVARKQLVWEAIAQERLRTPDFVFEQTDVRKALDGIFARFPRRVAIE